MIQTSQSRTVGGEIADELREHMRRQQVALETSFQQLGAQEMKKVPFAVFQEHFLDWFSGKKQDTGELRKHWISIAGGVFDRVELVDENGTKIDIVPPLCDRQRIATTVSRDGRSDYEFTNAHRKADVYPHHARSIITTMLRNRFSRNIRGTSEEFRQEWAEFLKKYQTPEQGAAQSNTTGTGGEIELLYE